MFGHYEIVPSIILKNHPASKFLVQNGNVKILVHILYLFVEWGSPMDKPFRNLQNHF